MKDKMPMFGVSVGIATAFGYIPHVLFLLIIVVSQSKNATPVFLMFTVLARILGDWIFWTQMFPSRVGSSDSGKDWQLAVKNILFSKSKSISAMIDMVIDAGVDVLLVYMAFKASASPVWIFLVFSASQAAGAFLQGALMYVVSRKGLRLFSMIVTALATLAALEVNGVVSNDSYMHMFGLNNIAKPLATLLILGAKCLFTGTSVIGKTNIAETIKLETMKELREA